MNMTKSHLREIQTANLCEHDAVKAWAQREPERVEPESGKALKLRTKSAVYRLAGSARTAGGSAARSGVEEVNARTGGDLDD